MSHDYFGRPYSAVGNLPARAVPSEQAHARCLQRLGLRKAVNDLRVLHIAGTKGKGSTAAFTSAILSRCGYKVGLFTSPHLCDVRERVRINGHASPYLLCGPPPSPAAYPPRCHRLQGGSVHGSFCRVVLAFA